MKIWKNNMTYKNMNRLNMEICDIAYAYLDASWHSENLRSAFTRIYMITSGEASVTVGQKTIFMVPGTIYVIPANTLFSYDCANRAEKLFAHVMLQLPGHFDVMSQLQGCIILPDREEEIAAAIDCYRSSTVNDILQLRQYFSRLLLECLSQQKVTTPFTSYSPLLQDALQYIEEHLSIRLTVEEIAGALYISTGKLQQLFRREMNLSVGSYVDDLVVLLAEREVRSGKASMLEISEKFGFCDQFYFSRVFAKKYGAAPLRYRKIHQAVTPI